MITLNFNLKLVCVFLMLRNPLLATYPPEMLNKRYVCDHHFVDEDYPNPKKLRIKLTSVPRSYREEGFTSRVLPQRKQTVKKSTKAASAQKSNYMFKNIVIYSNPSTSTGFNEPSTCPSVSGSSRTNKHSDTFKNIYEESEDDEMDYDMGMDDPLKTDSPPDFINDDDRTLEFDLFGEYISMHLQQLPLEVALKLQRVIHNLVTKERLDYIRQNPDNEFLMVKLEPREDEEEEPITNPDNTTTFIKVEEEQITKPDTTTISIKEKEPIKTPDNTSTSIEEEDASRSGNRPSELEPPKAKSQKLNSKPTNNSSPRTYQNKKRESKRANCIVFAKQIAVQLEQLPEDLALQLQTNIYAMITQAFPELSKDDTPEKIEIKDEPIDVSMTDIMYDS